ncbi:MAG: DUF4168 domain-containing protein [Desulfosalsimonadaceae bacterium]
MNARTLKRKRMNWKSIALIFAASFLVSVPPLAAQQGQQGQQGQQYQHQEPTQQQPAANFSDQDLQKFAKAEAEVNEIRAEYSEAIKGVEAADKAKEIQSKYTEQMINTIEDEGLSLNKYNKIAKAAQEKPDLQKKIDNMAD